MNHVMEVEVVETFCDATELAEKSQNFPSRGVGETHEAKSVCTGVLPNILHYVPARHPVRNELEGGGGNTPEGDYIWVLPVLPHYSLLVKLWGLLRAENGRKSRDMVPFELPACPCRNKPGLV